MIPGPSRTFATKKSRFGVWDPFFGPQIFQHFLVFCMFCQISPSVQGPRFRVWGALLGAGAFLRPGGSKNAKNPKTSKAEPSNSSGVRLAAVPLSDAPRKSRQPRRTAAALFACSAPLPLSCHLAARACRASCGESNIRCDPQEI